MSPTPSPLKGAVDHSTLRQGTRTQVAAYTGRRPGAPQPQQVLRRRYEMQWLGRDGMVEYGTRVAPATPMFEDAFAAFGRGTLIATEHGPIAVEDLMPGTHILTVDGGAQVLTWIGNMTVVPNRPDDMASHTGGEANKLIRIAAEAFGHDRPSPDLLLGPRARLLYRNDRCRDILGSSRAFAPARAFADGNNVIEVTPATPVRVYHLALHGQHGVYANGIEVESFHPGLQIEAMLSPEMRAAFLSMFPHLDTFEGFGGMPLQRLTAFELESLRAA